MSGVTAMLAMARQSLGWGEPNPIHKWYGKRNGSYFAKGSTPWCDMSITYWAYHSGNYAEVCPAGDRAYTVWHAQDFEKRDQWFAGTAANLKKARPGDIVFFDWGGSNSIRAVDHVGVVEKNLGGGKIQTIEGNTLNMCARRTRDSSTVAGFGRPEYKGSSSSPMTQRPRHWAYTLTNGVRVTVPWGVLSEGDTGKQVRHLQHALNELTGSKLEVDGDYGPATGKAIRRYQNANRDENGKPLEVDGVYGHHTARALNEDAIARKGPANPNPAPVGRPQTPEPKSWQFPDISYYQPGADIQGILEQSQGVICIRAGFGVGFKDAKFDTWREQAKDARVVMIYHFVVRKGAYGGRYDGTINENADQFVKWVGRLRPNEVPVIDVESASGNWSAADVGQWRKRVQEKLGGPVPLVYANQAYVHENDLEALFTTSKGWVAKYGRAGQDASRPDVKYIAWQHAADGYGKPRVHWKGCAKTADENRVDGITPTEFTKRVLDK